jgi:hypothetical protein
MVIKSSNEYHILAIILLILIGAFSCVLLAVTDNTVFFCVIASLLLSMVIRFWISACRVLTMDAEGCKIQFLWFERTYKWKDLKTKRVEDYTTSIGYRQPYTAGAIFYKRVSRKPRWLKPAEYSMYVHPFSFFFVYFDSHIQFGKWDLRCPDLYVVDEVEFRENMKKWNVEIWGQGDGSVVPSGTEE